MKKSSIELGDVFQTEWSENPIRVIAFDSSLVMYDAWWPHKAAWGMEKLSGNFSYYRLPLALLLESSRYLRNDKYSEQEALIHRPDLPFAFAQIDLNWYDQSPKSIEELEQLLSCNASLDKELRLNVPAIFLSPFGPKGSSKPASLVHAKNGESFSEAEIIWHSWQLQAPQLRTPQITTGVGIYRSGIKQRIPSYYIWGSKSRMDS